MLATRLVPLVILLLATTCGASPRDELLNGVKTVARPGLPGTVVAFGEHAGGLIQHAADDARLIAAWADVPDGGRVILFGHGGFLETRDFDTPRLRENAIAWLARGKTEPAVVSVGMNYPGATALGRDWGRAIQEADVLVMRASRIRNETEARAVAAFLRRGGGWLTADTGWGWEQINKMPLQAGHVGNTVLADLGLAVAGDTTRSGPKLDVVPAAEWTNARPAVDVLKRATEHDVATVRSAGEAVRAAAAFVPADSQLRRRIADFARFAGNAVVPRGQQPNNPKAVAIGRVGMALRMDDYLDLPPDDVPADSTAGDFPGSVPDDAERVSKSLEVDASVPRWHTTGMYAAPGEVVMVTAENVPAGTKLRIGAHSDELFHKPTWNRAPRITADALMTDGTTRLACAFGGPVYIDVPNGASETFKVTIENAVNMPVFKLGETDVNEWRDTIRHHPAPWAELACDSLILTMPAESLRKIEDPTKLAEHWQAVQDANAKLAGLDPDRERPMRIVNDVQISAGYMHAGYPIMTWLDVVDKQNDFDYLYNDAWGFYHELGHNHQKPAWTWSGLGEVTCNWFSMYVLETVCGQSPEEATKRALQGRAWENVEAHLKRIAAGEASNWKSGPFEALAFFADLRMAFGWEPYERLLARYERTPADELPRGDAACRDRFYEWMSEEVERDLSPYFDAWGVPLTDEARRRVKALDLEPWQSERVTKAIEPTPE